MKNLGNFEDINDRAVRTVPRLPPPLPEVRHQLQQQNAGSRAIPAQQVLQETIIQGTSKLPIYMQQNMETTTSALPERVLYLCRWLEKHIK